MNEKKNSAVQRVFKSVVGPAIGTSLALLVGCSTSPAPTDKPIAVTPESIPLPGQVEPMSQGAVVSPASVPATVPVSLPVVGITSPRPDIPDPGKIAPPEKVGKVAPEIHKVGKVAPTEKPIPEVGKTPNPGIIRPPGKVPELAPPKVGTVTPPKVGTHMEVSPEGSLLDTTERPTRFTRRATDESGGVLRTGFVGGRKLT